MILITIREYIMRARTDVARRPQKRYCTMLPHYTPHPNGFVSKPQAGWAREAETAAGLVSGSKGKSQEGVHYLRRVKRRTHAGSNLTTCTPGQSVLAPERLKRYLLIGHWGCMSFYPNFCEVLFIRRDTASARRLKRRSHPGEPDRSSREVRQGPVIPLSLTSVVVPGKETLSRHRGP